MVLNKNGMSEGAIRYINDNAPKINANEKGRPRVVEDLVTTAEMAEKLKVSKDKLAQLRNENVIPFIKTGRKIHYQPSEVIDALKVLPNSNA